MKVGFLVFILAITFMNLQNVYAIQVEEPISNTTNGNTTVLEYIDEYIIIKEEEENLTFIISEPKEDSEENILSYQQKLEERLEYLNGTSYSIDGGIPTTLTFSNLLSEQEISEIANVSGFQILSLRYVSTDGGGETPYPIDHERLAKMEDQIAELERLYNNITNFVLIKGFVAAEIFVPLENETNETSKNNNLLLIDVGPIEFLELYPNATIIPGRDLFYQYNKIIASNDTEPPEINYVNVSPPVTNFSNIITVTANVTDNVVVDKVNITIAGVTFALADTDGDGIFTNDAVTTPTIEGTYEQSAIL